MVYKYEELGADHSISSGDAHLFTLEDVFELLQPWMSEALREAIRDRARSYAQALFA